MSEGDGGVQGIKPAGYRDVRVGTPLKADGVLPRLRQALLNLRC